MNQTKSALSSALGYLTRREHGAEELVQKLLKKGYAEQEARHALLECQKLGYQSDQRFAESMCRLRVRQGYGPERIRLTLQQKQIDQDIVAEVLELGHEFWMECAEHVLHKKYKSGFSTDYHEAQKQKQFLLYRGFSNHMIKVLAKGVYE